LYFDSLTDNECGDEEVISIIILLACHNSGEKKNCCKNCHLQIGWLAGCSWEEVKQREKKSRGVEWSGYTSVRVEGTTLLVYGQGHHDNG
jgi:hypothetical protein